MNHAEILIVGAGPAGLAMAACLRRRGVGFEVLEKAEAVGSSWRSHYERLHLHTPAAYGYLPYRKFPSSSERYPSRQAVVDYLTEYAGAFEIKPRFGIDVSRAYRSGDAWHLDTSDGPWTTKKLIVATGINAKPRIPRFDGDDDFVGRRLHSKEYWNGEEFRGKRVLVVGAGNSGAEIALDLFEHGAKPLICIRGPIHVVARDIFGLPAQLFGLVLAYLPLPIADGIALSTSKRTHPDLGELGIERPTKGPIRSIVEDNRVPMIDIGTVDLIRRGDLEVVPAIESFHATGARFVGGRDEELDAVVFATGYETGLADWLETDAIDDLGRPHVFLGPAAPGLYFIGFRPASSGAFRDMGIEARALAPQF